MTRSLEAICCACLLGLLSAPADAHFHMLLPGAASVNSSVPPTEFYSGDLHNWVDANGKMYQIYDPFSQTLVNGSYVRTPFAGNIVPPSRIDPIAL